MLNVISFAGHKRERNCTRAIWLVKCDCGTYKKVVGKSLRDGSTTSCGCRSPFIFKHGMKNTVEYITWINIKQRIYNKMNPAFAYYNKRTMCERWRNSFIEFFKDMGNRPNGKMSIERLDNSIGYTCGKCNECRKNKWPANCAWKDYFSQANNTTKNVFISYKGQRKTVSQWSKFTGIKLSTIWNRIRLGWSPRKIFKTKVRTHIKVFTYNGHIKALSEFFKEYGINASTLYYRIYVHGWPIEKALTQPVKKQSRRNPTTLQRIAK